jgi:hypothetical protein
MGQAQSVVSVKNPVGALGTRTPVFVIIDVTPVPTGVPTNTAVNTPSGTSPTFTPTVTKTPTTTPTPINVNPLSWAPNGPGWLGPSPADDLAVITSTGFNASSTPVRVATPKASGYTDLYFTVTNIGTANGGGVVYLGGRSVTISALGPSGSREKNVYIQDLSANAPVSLSGDATAATTIIYTNIYARRRAP